MENKIKTEELINELSALRRRISELEESEIVRRRVEEALHQEKEKFQVLVEKSPLGVSLLDKDGQYKYEDITEQRKLEAQLTQSQKMEAVGRLAGGVAHDFNNLLTTIMGNADLISLNLSKENPLQDNVEEINKASSSAAALIRQLLAFSRKQVLKLEVVNLNTVTKEMDKILRRLIGEDIELATVFEPELWNVKADPAQIEQVIMNLAVNARDAMPKGGKLTIETANMKLDESYFQNQGVMGISGFYVMIAVSDTGIGMDKETCSRIFEPFFTTKEKGKGSGLGLATVYGIVKQSDGFIWVYSEPGQGTCFKIYFPKAEEKGESPRDEDVLTGDLNGSETLLVVEDNEMVRNLVIKVLQNQGYKVLEAENGVKAIRLCEQYEGRIHMLITDVVMPKLSGRELEKRLATLLPPLKVLYISGYTDDAIVHHGILGKGVNFLQKPFTPEKLAAKVREILDQE